MNLILGMAFFFIIITLIFVAIAIFLPEWMGITGNHAKRIIAEQQEQKPEEQGAEEKDSASPTSSPKTH
ncbi:hypothetical protein AZI86_16360 [Bdellovibrio bacteriovorus]|uniref:Uncharacterized protein n=1 Tax=Bdellovibrio bacteriovorus TaxID=959 RepID=A0A150WH34_BDEBC|nr:hypothetical protein [Bdellovibrio bacteriovorus]KYG62407.1 hypothetical protein AZI86_16360 [Bdellovibrio bacteriovorus]